MIKEEKKDTIEEESLQETASAESEEATEETAEETNGEGASKEESKENNELEELKEEDSEFYDALVKYLRRNRYKGADNLTNLINYQLFGE